MVICIEIFLMAVLCCVAYLVGVGRRCPHGDERGVPRRLAARRRGLGEVAEDRERARRAPPGDRPKAELGEVLGLIDDDVAVRARRPLDQPARDRKSVV